MKICFVRRGNKNNDLIQQLRVVLLMQEPAVWCRTRMRCALFTSRGMHMLWYCHEHVSKTDTEENKLLNKVIIFVFFPHKKFSCSFIILQLNHCCHMDYFNNVFTTFGPLTWHCCLYRVRKLLDFIKNILYNLCSEDEQRSCRFGMTWGWVINGRI